MARVPKRLVDDLDSPGLDASDRHLLSLVDSSLSEEDLAFVTGKSLDGVAEDLERLAMLGFVEFVAGGASASSDRPSSARHTEAGEAESSAHQGTGGDTRSGSAADAAQPKGKAAALAADEEVDLSPDEIAAIDELHGKLDQCNYYELLGLETDATKKEIRKAYNKLARTFHPDRHFRKKLGPYKQRIEIIFARLTRAHDTLRANKLRAEYDESERIEKRFDPEEAKRAKEASASAEADAAAKSDDAPAAPTAEPAATPSAEPAATPSTEPAATPTAEAETGPRGEPATPAAAGQSAEPAPQPAGPARAGATSRRPAPATSRRPAPRVRPRVIGAAGIAGAAAPAMARSGRPDSSVRPAARARSVEPSSPPQPPARSSEASLGGRTSSAPPSSSPPDDASVDRETARRLRAEALRRKLRASARAPSPAAGSRRPRAQSQPRVGVSGGRVSSAPAETNSYEPPPDVEQSAAEVFRSRFDRIGAHARKRRCERYLAQGKAAFSRGDFRLAAEAFRLAAELAPDDAAIKGLAEQAAEMAAK